VAIVITLKQSKKGNVVTRSERRYRKRLTSILLRTLSPIRLVVDETDPIAGSQDYDVVSKENSPVLINSRESSDFVLSSPDSRNRASVLQRST
jgi:hypothetical protein